MLSQKIRNQNSSSHPDHFKIHLAAVCFVLILISIFIPPSASQSVEAKLQSKDFYSEMNIDSNLKVVEEKSIEDLPITVELQTRD
ncbi:MAG: hypothetical protein PHO48_00205 [Candidatus Gracilibacteria bacterium]|nr:hypothetical protein [Candidatus Gracilibacteria bacterium]MDD5178692.1 hypothetical protein [Candidatus Gracilibacteria bacterium]